MKMLAFSLAAAGALLAVPATASTLSTLTATWEIDFDEGFGASASPGDEAFVIEFDDHLGSLTGVLEQSEFQSFTWITDPFNGARPFLDGAPTIDGVVSGFNFVNGITNGPWGFGTPSQTFSQVAADAFSYSTDIGDDPGDPGVGDVPLPGAALFLLTGLAGLAVVRGRGAAARA